MTGRTGGVQVIERRIFTTEFREVPGSNGRQRWATAVAYNVVDDYGTIWLPRVFNDGLDARMPTILYGHDWWTLDHVLGQGIDYADSATGVDVLFEFADPDLVPSAARAMALTLPPNPILKDVSVGFDRQEWLRKDELAADQLAAGAEEAMVRAVMDELSIVVRGAVPGAQMRGKRTWLIDGTVTDQPPVEEPPHPEPSLIAADDVVDLARRVNSGEVTFDDARTAVALMAGDQRALETMVDDADEDTGQLALAVDAALDAAIACAAGVDVTGWPSECQQMFGCVVAAETAADDLLEALGLADPDDEEEPPAPEPPPVVAAAAPAGEERSVSDSEIQAAVALAEQRRR